MDGISSAMVVIGLVQTTTQVTTTLAQYVSRVKEAESSRAKLLDQMKLILAAEKAIESIVRDPSRPSRTPETQNLIDEWFKEDGLPVKYKKELEELLKWLEGQLAENNKSKRWVKRIAWPIKENKIQTTIQAFEGYILHLQKILSLETFNVVDSIETRYKDAESAAAKSELLSWLQGFDCTNKHESTLRERQQATGDWLFRDDLYIDWRRGSTNLVWLHGKAGAGKSVLASVVIDDLSNNLADDETLAYFYCNFRNIHCTRAMEVLRSVTKQLLWNSGKDWLPSFSDLTSRKARGSGPPTELGILLDLLKRAAELHERPIIVVDAMDECEDLPNLLDELVKLAHGHCRLFVTSRTIHAISVAFTGLPSINLDYRVEEMRSDIHFHIKTELESRSRLKVLKQDLKDEIEAVLVNKAGGMFRWVQCQLDRLNECYSLGDVREVLDTLPATLYKTYDQMLYAIDKKPFGRRRARRALTWLVAASIPLTLMQLAEAMSIDCDKPARDSVSAPLHKNVIPDILGSLVIVDGNLITLSHYSVKEYLTSKDVADSNYYVDRTRASLELTRVSIFSLFLFSDQPETTVEDRKDCLYLYASDWGFEHLKHCPHDHNESLVQQLLALQNHVSTHRLAYKYAPKGSAWWKLEMPQLALYTIIRFGHVALLGHYLDSHHVEATEEDNPLVFAALNSDVPRVQLLLRKGLDVNLAGTTYGLSVRMTPLTAAARNCRPENQADLVKLLLQNGCIVLKDALHSILSCYSGARCQSAVVRILLEHGADPQLLSAERRSCLHLALAPFGFLGRDPDDEFEIIRMLVAAGCDPTTPDNHGRSPFQLAIQSLSTKLVEWLLERGFPLPSNAVLCAASGIKIDCGRELLAMLESLLVNGAIAGTRDNRGNNALHHVSRHIYAFLFDSESMESVVRLLVKHGCDINCRNDAGETPMHLAVTSFNLFELRPTAASPNALKPDSILDIFVSQGAKLPADVINYAVKVFQHRSVGEGQERIISTLSLLKKFGASCRSQTTNGDNALHWLLKQESGRKDMSGVASFLVENGCDVRTSASSGETTLQLAIENGFLSFARSILSQIPEPYPELYHRDSDGNGVLHRLCYWQPDDEFDKVERVELLREAGYDFTMDINRPNGEGFTPLSIALVRGRAMSEPAIVGCLLDLGASFDHVIYLDLVDLEWASDMAWYRDVKEAQRHCLFRSETTFDDVNLVHHLLGVAHGGRLSGGVASSILDMAEYWACTKITMNDVPYASLRSGKQIPIPMAPGDAGRWIPRRLIFSCKAGELLHRAREHSALIEVNIRRGDAVFLVPIYLRLYQSSFGLRSTDYYVWDEIAGGRQTNGSERVTVGELVAGDAVRVEIMNTSHNWFALERFQIEVYYGLKSLAGECS